MTRKAQPEPAPLALEVLRLSMPAILTQITTIAMQYIDSAMVGALGANASASIGLVSSATWFFGGFITASSTGFSVQIAHAVGAGESSAAQRIFRLGLKLCLAFSLLLCVCGALLSFHLPKLLGADPAIWRDSGLYFLIFSLMLPFSQLSSLCSASLQCAGDMLTPSILNAVMCALDVCFNALFIPRLGVLGAAVGTELARAVIALCLAYVCFFRNGQLRSGITEPVCSTGSVVKKALALGTPVAVQEAAIYSAMILSTAMTAPLGPAAIAANSFAITAEGLCYMPGYGIGAAATTLVGRSIGAGERRLAKSYGSICTLLGGAFMAVTGGLMMLACPLVFRLLTPVEEVRALAVSVLRIGLLAEPLYGVSIAAAGALRGAGDTLVPSLLNLLSIWLVRIGLAHFLIPLYGLSGMWTAMAIELGVRGLLMLARQLTSKYYK